MLTSLFDLRPSAVRNGRRLAAVRDRRIRALVAAAYRDVAFYRRAFDDAGVRPDKIRGVADLERLPVVEKSDLRAAGLADRLAKWARPERLISHHTSGSTGEPFQILRTRYEEYLLQAYQHRSNVLNGLRRGEARAYDVGLGFDPRWIHRWDVLPAFAVDPVNDVEGAIVEMRRRKPAAFNTRPNTLHHAAQAIERAGGLGHQLRFVFSGGEVLEPSVRRYAERVFGCPVLDLYGAHEVALIGFECARCRGYHVLDDSVVVEVLDGDRPVAPGEVGDAVVTALHSYAMPFVRYRLRDRIRRPVDPPRCEWALQTIDQPQGRRLDPLRLSDGTSVPAHRLMHAVREVEGVARYQVRQEHPDLLHIPYIELPAASASTGAEIESALRAYVPARVTLRIEKVAELPFNAAGKHVTVLGYDRLRNG